VGRRVAIGQSLPAWIVTVKSDAFIGLGEADGDAVSTAMCIKCQFVQNELMQSIWYHSPSLRRPCKRETQEKGKLSSKNSTRQRHLPNNILRLAGVADEPLPPRLLQGLVLSCVVLFLNVVLADDAEEDLVERRL